MGYLRLAVACVLVLSLAACGKSVSSEPRSKAENAKPAPSAVGGSQEQPAKKDDATQKVELKGKDLIAWKLAYEAAGHEADAREAKIVSAGHFVSHKMCVVPDVPRRHLMKKTPTGDYQFSFGMEFHQFWPDRDDCLLGTLIITVTDFGATMRGTKAEGDFFALKDTKMFHDYVKLFGETEGVKADRKRMTR